MMMGKTKVIASLFVYSLIELEIENIFNYLFNCLLYLILLFLLLAILMFFVKWRFGRKTFIEVKDEAKRRCLVFFFDKNNIFTTVCLEPRTQLLIITFSIISAII